MMHTLSVRGYLLLLQSMFVILYVFHLEPPLTRPDIVMIGILAAFTVMIFTIPTTQLTASWCLSGLVLGHAAVLFSTMPHGPGHESGMIGAVILLLAMASYLSSAPHFAMVSSLLVMRYGLSLFHADLLPTATILLMPVFLCVTLVFLSKIGLFQAEMQRLIEETSRQTSTKDSLTGLPNRAHFLEQVGRIIQYRFINRNFHFALLFIDLDGFKPINDTLGHKAGDAVLRHVAKLLQASVRKGDLVGRFGGDEFIVLLNHVHNMAHAAQVADTILAKIRTPIQVGEAVVVGASIGIAMSTNLHEGAEDLIRDADAAMYQAKARGKNCYVVSDQSDLPKGELKARWKRVTQLHWLLREH